MHRAQLLRFALRQVLRARARLVALLAVGAIGTAALALALTYGAYARERTLDQINRMGPRLLVITPTTPRQFGPSRRAVFRPLALTAIDVRTLQWQIPAIERASPLFIRSARLRGGDLSRMVTVVGCEPSFFAMRRWDPSDGSPWTESDERSAARVVLLGGALGRDFPQDAVRLDGVRFTVRGVLQERGEGADGIDEDRQVYVPLTTAMRRLFHADDYSAIVLEARLDDEVSDAASESAALLQQRHHVRAEAVRIEQQKQAIEALRSASARLTLWLDVIVIACSAATGGGVSMMIWTEAADRRRELAVLRAIGATRNNLIGQLLAETAARALGATALGLAAAAIGWRLAASRLRLPLALDSRAVLIALAAALLAQMAGAYFGARRTNRLEIVEALRGE